MKATLLRVDYKSYRPMLRTLGHNLSELGSEVRKATKLHVFIGAAGQELSQLERFYKHHLLRYAHSFDIIIDARTIPCARVTRHLKAVVELCQRRGTFER